MKSYLTIAVVSSVLFSLYAKADVYECTDKYDPESCEVKGETSSPIFAKGQTGQVLMYDDAGNLVPQSLPEKSAKKSVVVYQCPNGVEGNLPGGQWGFYGCTGQITTSATCDNIHYPHVQTRQCTRLGQLGVF
ncbi:hypothetical protein [Vibrio mangrovi]|uniref:DUF4124 domain-containing protein n=1 Tax=Vibrio mangrovi TaxID=474394 RepID=A0A1Y6IY43_9VIBR|nr:hypothetical protein [Vibrio mangrovi]MDW6005216.1 hypothetical protein [Vibrio mangrovi]SMS02574.1 hypothetical protein VIM7927_03907 [Vibrio mangrovi]